MRARALPIALVLTFASLEPSTGAAEVVCSYLGDQVQSCCDTETQYCDGFGVYAQQIWEDIQGTWKGTAKLRRNSCKFKTPPKRESPLTLRIAADGPYNPDTSDSIFVGRTQARRYAGYYTPPFGIDEPLVSFQASERYRSASGKSCEVWLHIDMPYFGGQTSDFTITTEYFCSDRFVCRTVRTGRVRKVQKVQRTY